MGGGQGERMGENKREFNQEKWQGQSWVRKHPLITTDHLNIAHLGNHGPNHDHDNPHKLKQTVRYMCGAVSTRVLQKVYSQQTAVVIFVNDKH